MSTPPKHIAIVGAGLVGSLLAIYLIRRGYRVSVFERRPDMRINSGGGGRSINLALSNRGLRALAEVGLAEELKKVAIPMNGRMMHNREGQLSFLAYGREGQYINSISRTNLNIVLLNEAERQGAKFFFDHRCVRIDPLSGSIEFSGQGQSLNQSFDFIFGTDGAYSAVRSSFQITDRFDFSQEYIEHGYKELHIPPGPAGAFQLEKNALHIWPRESFMMIALPNLDGSFTCTLFFPFDGPTSFESVKSGDQIMEFFKSTFPDTLSLLPNLLTDFKTPPSSLVTMRCFPWKKNKAMILGDAAHGVVPFYGQGMNAGFEDCRVLNQLLDLYQEDWEKATTEFQNLRKPDTDSIAKLALDNFIEMRDLVADADFLLRKKIEARLHELYPTQWIPLYSMVTFHDEIRYSEAQATGFKQKAIMDAVMQTPGLEKNWESLDFHGIVKKLTD